MENNNLKIIVFILLILVLYLLYRDICNRREKFAETTSSSTGVTPTTELPVKSSESMNITEAIKNLGLIAKKLQENNNFVFPSNLKVKGNLKVDGDIYVDNIKKNNSDFVNINSKLIANNIRANIVGINKLHVDEIWKYKNVNNINIKNGLDMNNSSIIKLKKLEIDEIYKHRESNNINMKGVLDMNQNDIILGKGIYSRNFYEYNSNYNNPFKVKSAK